MQFSIQSMWAPFYTYHRIMAGLIDMYRHAGNQQALEMALRMADWADRYARSFSDDDWERVLLVEHGGMNETSFNLYAITGKTRGSDVTDSLEAQPGARAGRHRAQTA